MPIAAAIASASLPVRFRAKGGSRPKPDDDEHEAGELRFVRSRASITRDKAAAETLQRLLVALEAPPVDQAARAKLQRSLTRHGAPHDVQQIASRQKWSVRQVNMTISLAFLAPDLVRAAVEGRLPRGIGVVRLRDAPAEWSQQFEALGLNPR
jgi:site-specific DNA recombinase